MNDYLLVFIGGGLGSIVRYGISKCLEWTHFPISTFIVNVVSSLLVGLLVGFFATKKIDTVSIRLLFITGFCGGFSTFSTFSLETFHLFNNSHFIFALSNILLHIVLCVTAIYVGFLLTKTI